GYDVAGYAFNLDDNSGLSITGPVSAASASLASTGSLDVSGSINTNGALTLSGSSLLLGGLIDSASVLALQSPGSITGTGTIIAADLTSGTITDGNVQLTGGFNSIGGIATLASDGSFAAGTFDLTDQIALGGGSLTANVVTLVAPSIDFTGYVTATSLLALDPPVSGNITQTSGAITTALLTSDNATDGNVILTSAGNSIAALGSFSAISLDLADATALSVTGPVSLSGNATLSAASIDFAGSLSSANLSLTSLGSITESSGAITTGTLSGGAVGNVVLNGSANTIATLGSFTAPGLNLTDHGSLNIAGNVSIGNLLELAGISGGVTQSSGTLSAGTLASLGSLGGDVILTDVGNNIGTLGGFTLSGNALDLVDGSALTIAGPVLASNASLTAAAIDLTGSIFTATDLTLTNTGPGGMTLAGLASVGSGLSLASDGNVSENGTLIAATLTGSASNGNVALTSGNNNIGTLG
ncbi:MAG: hypothetical protein P4L96_00005, partial [Rhodoferax sp.]|nr:hypothetical protein [Rhodoferax sp.]